MKNHLKIIVLCLGAGLGTLPALRADDTTPPPANPPSGGPDAPHQGRGGDREKWREKLVEKLNLTADQQTKWQGLEQQEREAIQALRADTTVPKDQRRGKMEEVRKNFEGQRRGILNPDQQTKFDEFVAKMRERMQNRHDGQGGTPPPAPPPPAPDGK